MRFFTRSPRPVADGVSPPRRLFLDDDPWRATFFLINHPEAVWVQTAAECIEKLGETWDEVHLDHDLGGEHFVEISREDCGMEVVRWLCLRPRPHLRRTRFTIHSHNPDAALMMGWQMTANGFSVEMRPFGSTAPAREQGRSPRPSAFEALGRWARRLLARGLDRTPETTVQTGTPPEPPR